MVLYFVGLPESMSCPRNPYLATLFLEFVIDSGREQEAKLFLCFAIQSGSNAFQINGVAIVSIVSGREDVCSCCNGFVLKSSVVYGLKELPVGSMGQHKCRTFVTGGQQARPKNTNRAAGFL